MKRFDVDRTVIMTLAAVVLVLVGLLGLEGWNRAQARRLASTPATATPAETPAENPSAKPPAPPPQAPATTPDQAGDSERFAG